MQRISIPYTRNSHIHQVTLTLIILVAFLTRLVLLWVGRPEFVGWFNHTYYYYVETRGLISSGALPYPDMPLLFHLYASTAKFLSWVGIAQNTAVVSATRFWMCLVPSLTPLPVYLSIICINRNKAPDWRQWMVIGASALLPLSLVHQPEFSQKNVLGVFFLFLFIYLTIRALFAEKVNPWTIIGLLAAFVLVVLSHFGTTAVALLYVSSLVTAYLFVNKYTRSSRRLLLAGLLLAIVSIAIIYSLDIDRFYRIWHYTESSLRTSFIGSLFSSQSGILDKVIAGTSILIPLVLLVLFYRIFKSASISLGNEHQVFWLSHIVFFYLLLLPVYDQLLLARFAVYLSIPILFIVVYLLKFSNWRSVYKTVMVAVLMIGILTMAFGEYMSLKMHGRNNQEIFADLMSVKQRVKFNKNDLIITKNGAEHICNWFLGTKSGVITALNKNDFELYGNIYLLNPIEGQLNFSGIEGKRADNEKDRYLFMLRNIPRPQNATMIYESEYMQLLKLEAPPGEWKYHENGYWLSY